MYIDDIGLRRKLKQLLLKKTRNEIVSEIKSTTGKFHQYQIDNFLKGADISLKTAIKLDEYILRDILK